MWLGELGKALLKFLNRLALKLIETCKGFCPEVIRHAPSSSGDGARDGGDGDAVATDGDGVANCDSKLSASKNASRACGTDPAMSPTIGPIIGLEGLRVRQRKTNKTHQQEDEGESFTFQPNSYGYVQ